MIIKEINCKTILNKSKLMDYCINPYTGCQHKCSYCYARFMKKYTNHKEEWGDFVDVKINAVEALKNDLKKAKPGSVFISSVTDCYQPIEKKYEITRKILETLPKDFSIYILTKSKLVLRDLDLIKKFKNAEVGFTITFSDDSDRKNFEPFASSINDRIEALKKIKNAGIKASVFFGPVIPFISDKSLEEFLEKIKSADEIWIDRLNIKSGNWSLVEKILKERYPGIFEKIRNAVFDDEDYYLKLKENIKNICRKKKIKVRFCY